MSGGYEPPPTPSAPPSYEDAIGGYPDLSNYITPHLRHANDASLRSGSPFEFMGADSVPTQGNLTSANPIPQQSVRSDHWGVIGYFQPVQPQDAMTSSDPYVVLSLPEDVLPKVTPQHKLQLPFLQYQWTWCCEGMHEVNIPPYFKNECKVSVDPKYSLGFDKVNLLQRQVRVFAAAPQSVLTSQGVVVSRTKASYQTTFIKNIADKLSKCTLRISTPTGLRFYRFQSLHSR